MLFSSITFLYYFLPAFLLLYYLVPARLKNSVILLASLIFYAWGEPKYIFLMAVSILLGYLFGLLIEKTAGTGWAKLWLYLSVITGLGMLAFFKYTDFFISNFNHITGLAIPLLKIALPIGISFYTFQVLSYTADVYRGEAKAQRNLISFAAYVSLFPQLIAGPIVRYADIAANLEKRSVTAEDIYLGIRRFIAGLSKKVLIANSLGTLCSIFRDSDEKSVLFYWIYALSFALQIYFDFSGYSDMAIGLGKILGFHFLENFNYPYISKSITEFWRRWHISLSTWFRDYVYIPLGGNRVSGPRWLFNIAVVWLLTGFWHGAAWNFILWGAVFALLLIVEKLWFGNILKKCPAIVAHVYVLFVVLFSFVLFNGDGLAGAASDIKGMLGLLSIPLSTADTIYYLRSYAVALIMAAIGSTPLLKSIATKLYAAFSGKRVMYIIEPVILAALLLLVTAYLVDGSFSPFLYFRF